MSFLTQDMLERGKVVSCQDGQDTPHRGGEKEGANSTPLCDTNPRRGWVKRGSLCQDEQSQTRKTG